MNLNSLNGNVAPAPPAPKGGPPIAVIVIVILVIIGIVVGVVMATRPAPKAAALPATVPPPSPAAVTPPPPPSTVTPPSPAAVTPPPPPATVPIGSAPASSMGREVVVSSVAMTPDQMLAAKQAQADMRYAEPKLTNEQLAQAQRDAGKKVDIPKEPRLQENINTMKIADVKNPRDAQEFGMKMGLLPAQMGGKIAKVGG